MEDKSCVCYMEEKVFGVARLFHPLSFQLKVSLTVHLTMKLIADGHNDVSHYETLK